MYVQPIHVYVKENVHVWAVRSSHSHVTEIILDVHCKYSHATIHNFLHLTWQLYVSILYAYLSKHVTHNKPRPHRTILDRNTLMGNTSIDAYWQQ